MKKIIELVIIYTFFIGTLTSAQTADEPKEQILSNMTVIYNVMIEQPDKNFYARLDSLILLERQLYKYTIPKEHYGFLDYGKANEIVKNVPDQKMLYRNLLKYKYDTVVTVNNALYSIHASLRSISKDTIFIQQLTNRVIDFCVFLTPCHYIAEDYSITDTKWYYNQEAIDKLVRIAKKQYTSIEKDAAKIYWGRCKNFEPQIYFELSRKYSKELYQTEPNKKKRKKKINEVTPDILIKHYPEQYRQMYDSLMAIYANEGIHRLFKKDVSGIIYVLGKIYAKTSIPALKTITRDTINHSVKERYMARVALARLGVQEYEAFFLKKEQPKAGELIYISSQVSAYRFAELMKDTAKTTGCFPWIWEIAGKEYKDMKVSLAFKYLWILNRANFIKGFSVPFDYNYDDYCLFYTSNTYSKEKERTLIENAINWLEENRGDYELNPYAYDYNLNY